jgi:hypothetical protein
MEKFRMRGQRRRVKKPSALTVLMQLFGRAWCLALVIVCSMWGARVLVELALTSHQRFVQHSRYPPVPPVFGKGDTRLQPVYVGDIGLLVEILTRNSPVKATDGKIIEAQVHFHSTLIGWS